MGKENPVKLRNTAFKTGVTTTKATRLQLVYPMLQIPSVNLLLNNCKNVLCKFILY